MFRSSSPYWKFPYFACIGQIFTIYFKGKLNLRLCSTDYMRSFGWYMRPSSSRKRFWNFEPNNSFVKQSVRSPWWRCFWWWQSQWLTWTEILGSAQTSGTANLRDTNNRQGRLSVWAVFLQSAKDMLFSLCVQKWRRLWIPDQSGSLGVAELLLRRDPIRLHLVINFRQE